jgi:tetratricopeptide (TPR) repeat protein
MALALLIAAGGWLLAGPPAPAIPAPGAAAAQQARRPAAAGLVDRGVELYYSGRYRRALKVFKKAFKSGDLGGARRIAALQYRAFCHVALGETDAARATFRSLLETKPDFRLPAGTAPKIVRLFEQVQAAMAPPPPEPRLQHQAPAAPPAAGGVELQARLQHAPAGARLVLRYRHDPRSAYNRLPMRPAGGDRYRAQVPAPVAPGSRTLEYYLVLLDPTGEALLAEGSAGQPFRLAYAAPPAGEDGGQDEGISVHWWIWPVVGAVVLGSGLALGLTLADGGGSKGSALVRFELVD